MLAATRGDIEKGHRYNKSGSYNAQVAVNLIQSLNGF